MFFFAKLEQNKNTFFYHRLYECRSNGVRTLDGGKLYFKLKNKRLGRLRDKKQLDYNKSLDWRNLEAKNEESNSENSVKHTHIIASTSAKKKAGPLEVMGLPNYENLNEDEKKLCSTVRITPSSYLDYKKILTEENEKVGHLRLAEARRLVKIDVNKTRQIYDFLLENGLISKP